ncbi:hypothetical protein OBBRIDRAFT_606944 [Obba rivulosa]|uniref:DUF6593 domain-containing protein n=1 Tax=Obba rivulosa TaxID=1052685 RepID=A0A8E2ASU5_9APHY|nr:hypothetical protein OBBRIDRAFT_606944 [Obba rivulosa]
MAPAALTTPEPNQIYFMKRDDIRHGCGIIGFINTPQQKDVPVYYRLETPQAAGQVTRTTVYRNDTEPVAYLNWANGDGLGMATIRDKKDTPMSWLIMRGTVPNARMFISYDNRKYEWRRMSASPEAYDLYLAPDYRMGTFRRVNSTTPVGNSYAFMEHIIDNEALLLESLVALCINRWIDARPPVNGCARG